MADFCIYCLENREDRLDNAHLFPRSIGGRIAFKHCCKPCNNTLGHSVEAAVKDSTFLVTGIDRLGFQSKKNAYRNLVITDPSTGHPFKYNLDGILIPKRKLDDDGLATGDEEFVTERTLDYVRKNFPHWIEQVRQELKEGKDEIFLPREKLVRNRKDGEISINLQGKTAFPLDLVAKITYEGMFLARAFTRDILENFYRDTFKVIVLEGNRRRISVSTDFRHRARTYQSNLLRGGVDYTKLVYRPYHRMDLRVSTAGTLYASISFFGLVRYLVAIDKVELDELHDRSLLGKALFFPFKGRLLEIVDYPNTFDDILRRDDAFADALHKYYLDSREQ